MGNKKVTIQEYERLLRNRNKQVGKLFALFFIFLLLLASFQVFSLQAFHRYGKVDLKEKYKEMYQNKQEKIAKRGTIYDSQGNELAINIDSYNMYAILNPENKTLQGAPFFVEDPQKTAQELLNVLNLNNNANAQALFYSQLNKKDVSQVEFGTYGKNLSLEQKMAIDELKLPGISFTKNPTRYYPYGDFASYALGYSKYDNQGKMVGEMGIEKELDGYLRGQNGEVIESLDANGVPIDGQEPIIITPQANGSNVNLTIDTNIQAIIQEEMKKALEKQVYDMSYTIIVNPHNGEILGMYSLPTFDPNKRDVKNYTNPFSEYCFEPGSTIKTFLVAEAMERGVWNANNQTNTGTTTRPQWDGVYISDWLYNKHKTSWGMLEWDKGFYESSNTVMMDVLDHIGYDNWKDSLTNKWEFGKPVDSQLIKSSKCRVNLQHNIEYATSAFGQGITSNAYQMARAYSAFGNNGIMTTPHLVKSISDVNSGELIYNAKNDALLKTKQVISAQTTKQVLDLMKQVVTYQENLPYRRGTGYLAQGGSIPLAIKTGTAEVAKDGKYSKTGGEISSYATLAPADDPQIFMYTILVNPQSNYLDFLGTMVKNIADKTVNYLSQQSSGIKIDNNDNRVFINNYEGEDINKVAQDLNTQGMKTITLGSGNVIKQYPSPNTFSSKDQIVILRAQGDVSKDILLNKPLGEVIAIANIMDWDCHFEGSGIVSEIKDNETGVNVIANFPPQVAQELEKRHTG